MMSHVLDVDFELKKMVVMPSLSKRVGADARIAILRDLIEESGRFQSSVGRPA